MEKDTDITLNNTLLKTSPAIFIHKIIGRDILDSYLYTNFGNLNKDAVKNSLQGVHIFKKIWEYLHNVHKYIPLRQDHIDILDDINSNAVFKSLLNTIVKKDLEYVSKKIPNIEYTGINMNNKIIVNIKLPFILSDVYNWLWLVNVRELVVKNQINEEFLETHTFLYDPPENFMDANIRYQRYKLELAMLYNICLLGAALEEKLPEVYTYLSNIKINTNYIPKIVFKNSYFSEPQEDKCENYIMCHYAIENTSIITDFAEILNKIKTVTIEFVTKFKNVPSNMLGSVLERNYNHE